MAPVNFNKIPLEQLLGTGKILKTLICGTRGLKFLSRPLRIGDRRKDTGVSIDEATRAI